MNFSSLSFNINSLLLGGFLVMTILFFKMNSTIGIFVLIIYLMVFYMFSWNLKKGNVGKESFLKNYMMFYVILWVYVEFVFIFSYHMKDWWGDFYFFLFLFLMFHLWLSYCEKIDMKPHSSAKNFKIKKKF